MEHSEHTGDQQRAQLSALLDNELSEQERADLEAHLQTCTDCRAELESLRRASALLRALPQPILPRNFMLPVAAPAVPEKPLHALPTARQVSEPERRPPALPATRGFNQRRPVRALQWLSSIAAVLGIVSLLSSGFSTLSSQQRTVGSVVQNSASAPGYGGDARPTAPTHPVVSPPTTQPGVISTPAPTERPGTTSATPVGTQGTPVVQQAEPGQSSGASSEPLLSITGLGVLLLILSASGFAIAWVLRRRW